LTGRRLRAIPVGKLPDHRLELVVFVDERLEFLQPLGDLVTNLVDH
jgi:hypothetical protein